MPTKHHGRVLWREIAVSDIDATASFYKELLGWDIQSMPVGDENYTIGALGDRQLAGIVPTSHFGDLNLDPFIVLYIGVDDIDVARKAVVDNGGKLLTDRIDTPGIGSFSLVEDVSGAKYYAMQPADLEEEASPFVPAFSAFWWTEATMRMPLKAQEYYAAVHGWSFEKAPVPHDYWYVMGQMGPLGGMMSMDSDDWGDLPSHFMSYIAVEDVEASVAKLKELGGKVFYEPFDIPNVGRTSVVTEPSGAVFHLIQPVSLTMEAT